MSSTRLGIAYFKQLVHEKLPMQNCQIEPGCNNIYTTESIQYAYQTIMTYLGVGYIAGIEVVKHGFDI
jgi:hypothetical protein